MMELSDEDIQTWRCFIKKQFDNHEKVDALCDAALAHNAANSSNTPCCQDWKNCRDRCVPLAEYWKKQAATIAALQEEISRLTDNQRQQDSAAKREAREDSMKAKVKKVSLCHGPIPDTDLPVTDAKPVAWMGWKLNRDVDDSETRFATVSEAIAFRDSWREIVPLYTSPPDLAEARELVRECLTVANFSSIPAQDTQKRCINFLARTK